MQTTQPNLPASHQIPGRSISTGHNPGGGHRHGMLFGGRERVPDDQLSVLRRGHYVTLVRRPIGAQNLGRVSLKDATWLDVDERDHLDAFGGSAHWERTKESIKRAPSSSFFQNTKLTCYVVQLLTLLLQAHLQPFRFLLQVRQLIRCIVGGLREFRHPAIVR